MSEIKIKDRVVASVRSTPASGLCYFADVNTDACRIVVGPSPDQESLEKGVRAALETANLFWFINNEVTELRIRVNTWRRLFSETPERVHLLQHTAPFFFGMFEEAIFHDNIARMARLTDREFMGQDQRNASIRALWSDAESRLAEPERTRVLDLLTTAEKACEFARKPRNKYLSHLDYHHHVAPIDGSPAKKTDPMKKAQFDDAVAALEALISALAVPLTGIEIMWNWPGEEEWTSGNAKQALRVASQAYAASELLGSRRSVPGRDDPLHDVLEALRDQYSTRWHQLMKEGVPSPPDSMSAH